MANNSKMTNDDNNDNDNDDEYPINIVMDGYLKLWMDHELKLIFKNKKNLNIDGRPNWENRERARRWANISVRFLNRIRIRPARLIRYGGAYSGRK